MITNQSVLDYANAAQQRVSADTRALVKKTTLTLNAAATSLLLPAEIVRLEALYEGSTQIMPIGQLDYLRLKSGFQPSNVGQSTNQTWFTVIGRTAHFYPGGAAEARTLTAIYSYRPEQMAADDDFALAGLSERLISRLSEAYILLDDGQPELAQQELASYAQDAARMRARNRRAEGSGQQLRLAGRPRRF